MAIFTTRSVVIRFSTGTLGVFATLVYVFPTLSTSILFCNLCVYTIVNFTTQCGENRHTDRVNFVTLMRTKKNY